MYNYIICRFLNKDNSLSEKAYVYQVNDELYNIMKIGYQYRIVNENGYDYRGSVVEITGKIVSFLQREIRNESLVFLISDKVSELSKIKIKSLVKVEEVGKALGADIV